MSPQAQSFARQTFQEALGPGPSEQPKALERGTVQIKSATDQSPSWDYEVLEQELQQEFAFCDSLVFHDQVPDAAETARWVKAVRWVLDALRSWDTNEPHAAQELRVLLVVTGILDAGSAGIEAVASHVGTPRLLSGVQLLIDNAEVGPFGMGERHYPVLRQELMSATQESNYERLEQLVRNLRPQLQTDMVVAIVLLRQLQPDVLSNAIVSKHDVLFSMIVCHVLEDSAAHFALQVPLVSFKFVSIPYLQHAHQSGLTTYDWVDLLKQILMQVAHTPDWAGWMHAYFQYPASQSLLMGEALAKALVDLEEKHWADFIAAISLSYSRRAAEPVAKILVHFAQNVGAEKAKMMWNIAFRRWEEWNYGKDEKDTHHFSPVACALDYPVAKHYAQLPSDELVDEEAKLNEVVEGVEQQWFNSATDLFTERNRLLSRLRLLRHGRMLATINTQLLPPPVQPEEDLYTQIRYHYHDVQIG